MATVKSYELAAYMTMVHDAISKRARKLHVAAITANPAPQLLSGYTPMRGKVDQAEVVTMAVTLAELLSKKERGAELNAAETLVYGATGNTLVDAIDGIREALQSRVAYDTTIKATLDYLENVTAAKAATDSLATRMQADLQKPNPWVVTLLDVLLATGLQSVPFVGSILSSVVQNGIVSAATRVVGGMAANQTQALRSTDPNLALASQQLVGGENDLNVMVGGKYGFVLGQKTHGTYTDPVTGQISQLDNDLGGQAAQNMANAASEHLGNLVNAGAYNEEAAKQDIRKQWYATGLNASFLYTMIRQSRERSEKKTLKVISNDAEFIRDFAARDTNRWLGMTQNPQTANQLVARFSNRGASNSAVQSAASLVGTEFEKTLRQDGSTLEAFANSIAGKLRQFRNLIDAFLSMSVSLALIESIDKFKTQAAHKNIDKTKFGLLKTSNQISATDENISAILILSYFFISEMKHNPDLFEKLCHTSGGEPFVNAVRAQMSAVEARRNVLLTAERLAATAGDLAAKVRQQQAVVQEAAEKLKGQDRFGALRVMPVIKAQQEKLAALQAAKASADKAAAALPGLKETRLKTFQALNSADPDAPANNVKMGALGSATAFSWRPSTIQSKNYVEQLKRATMQDIGAIFPSPGASGFEEAIKAVLACSVIVSNVHSQSARGQNIEIPFGAVSALGDEHLGFVHFYTKFLGFATSNDKRRAIGQWNEGTVTHRLRWPKDSNLSGRASIAETATLYAFAATVVAYVDLAEVALGTTTWPTYRTFLNEVIREINDKAIDLKNEDKSSYNLALKSAEAAFKANQERLKATLQVAKKPDSKSTSTTADTNKLASTQLQNQLIGKRKI